MKDYLNHFSCSHSSSEDCNQDSTIVKNYEVVSPHHRMRPLKRCNTYTDECTGVRFFERTSEVAEERPAIIQERVLNSEVLNGRIIDVMEEFVLLDVRSIRYPQKRLKLKVKKDIIIGGKSKIQLNMGVSVSFQRIRDYQGKNANRVAVRLREPALLPASIIEEEIEAKLRRFSYMFSK